MESGGCGIGDCHEGDIDEIVAIERDAFPTPWSEGVFRGEIASPLSRVRVARESGDPRGAVLGYAVYWKVADEIHLHNIAVRRDRRQQGIGSRLLAEAMGRSRSEGARWMTLEVRRTNDAAQRFYRKFGFSVRGVRRGYYTDTGEDALILWKELCPAAAGESAGRGPGEGDDA